MPTDERVYGRANLNHGMKYVTEYPPYYDEEDLGTTVAPVLPGHFEETASEYRLRWRVRGSPVPSEAELAKLAAEASVRNESWGRRVMTEDFYRDLIFPYVGRTTQTTPFDWAHERARLAVGFTATMALAHQTAPAKLIEPFMEIAGKVLNAPLPDAGETRVFSKTPKREALHAALKAHVVNPSAELMWFFLENEEVFTPEILEEPKVRAGLAELELCLENGLRINRLDEWFKLQSKGENIREALVNSLTFTKAIFIHQKAPWWFREDIPWKEWFDGDAFESGACDGVYKIAPAAPTSVARKPAALAITASTPEVSFAEKHKSRIEAVRAELAALGVDLDGREKQNLDENFNLALECEDEPTLLTVEGAIKGIRKKIEAAAEKARKAAAEEARLEAARLTAEKAATERAAAPSVETLSAGTTITVTINEDQFKKARQ